MAKSYRAADRSHARLYSHWRDLPAWRSLSLAARALLIEMMWDYRPDPGNNGYLKWPLRRAAKVLGCSKDTAAIALEELEACGWITCERIGGPGRRNGPSEYAVTMFFNHRAGHLATFAFERWEPSPAVIRARRSRVQPGGQSCPARRTDLSAPKDTRPKLNGPLQLSEAVLKTRIFKEKTGTSRKPD